MPRFREGLAELQAFYERILEQAFGVSEGVWLGTPFNLNLERDSGARERRGGRSGIRIWCCGARRMAGLRLPISRRWQQPCQRLITVPGIGHSMESRTASSLRRIFGAWFGGLPENEVAI